MHTRFEKKFINYISHFFNSLEVTSTKSLNASIAFFPSVWLITNFHWVAFLLLFLAVSGRHDFGLNLLRWTSKHFRWSTCFKSMHHACYMPSLPLSLSLSPSFSLSLPLGLLLHLECSRFETSGCFLLLTIRQQNYIEEISLFNFTMLPLHPPPPPPYRKQNCQCLLGKSFTWCYAFGALWCWHIPPLDLDAHTRWLGLIS